MEGGGGGAGPLLNYCSYRDKLFEDDAPDCARRRVLIVADVTNDDAGDILSFINIVHRA